MHDSKDAQESPQSARRAPLTRHTSVRDFRDFYWLKSELQAFCRSHGIPLSGGKRELADRIEHFLGTGQHGAPPGANEPAQADPEAARRFNALTAAEFSMNTRIPAGFRCTQALRTFLQQHVDPSFRFTVTLQHHIKAHPGISLQDLAAYWQCERAARTSGSFTPAISPQFEFNQFTRDYHADPANRGKTRADCLAAWKRTRDARGDNRYRPGDH